MFNQFFPCFLKVFIAVFKSFYCHLVCFRNTNLVWLCLDYIYAFLMLKVFLFTLQLALVLVSHQGNQLPAVCMHLMKVSANVYSVDVSELVHKVFMNLSKSQLIERLLCKFTICHVHGVRSWFIFGELLVIWKLYHNCMVFNGVLRNLSFKVWPHLEDRQTAHNHES